MTGDVPALFDELGVILPNRRGGNVKVSCFANAGAHKHQDKKPSCSLNVETGLWKCFVCGAKGNAYDAAIARGRAPAEVMRLLEKHGLREQRKPTATQRKSKNGGPKTPEPSEDTVASPTEDELRRYQQALQTNDPATLARLSELRGWTPEAIEKLGLGHDGERVIFGARDAGGSLVDLVRYEPDPTRRGDAPKMLASGGATRELFPAPETVQDGDLVWLLEGEPDAVAGSSLGLSCVSVPGVEGWKSEWATRFAGRRVVICLDCDDASRAAARRIAGDLLGVAAEVRIIALDPLWDDRGEHSDGRDLGDLVRLAPADDDRARLHQRLEALAAAAVPLVADTTESLLDDVSAFIRRFVVVSPMQVIAISLWVLHTHLIAVAEATPYLSITSPEKRSGKTRLLEVLELLVARAWMTGRVSAAVLSRKIDAESPTLLLDESDAAFRGGEEYAETLRGILNTGHRRGGKTSCCVGVGASITYADFSTYSAKAIAGIGKLPDTIADRSIAIRLQRRAKEEPVERFRRRLVSPEGADLHRRIERWASRLDRNALAVSDPTIPSELDDRAADGWEPLLAIADLAGGAWSNRARQAAVALSGEEVREDESFGIRLLGDIRAAFARRRGVDRLSTVVLIESLAGEPDTPWVEWWNYKDGKPERGAERKLAGVLKRYAIRPRSIRFAGGEFAKGYMREWFEEAWRRYLPASDPSHPSHPAAGAESTPDGVRHDDRAVTDPTRDATGDEQKDVTDVPDTGAARGKGKEAP
jgi:hypothetical protein